MKQYLFLLYAHAPRVQTKFSSRDHEPRVSARQTCGRLKHHSCHQMRAMLKNLYTPWLWICTYIPGCWWFGPAGLVLWPWLWWGSPSKWWFTDTPMQWRYWMLLHFIVSAATAIATGIPLLSTCVSSSTCPVLWPCASCTCLLWLSETEKK